MYKIYAVEARQGLGEVDMGLFDDIIGNMLGGAGGEQANLGGIMEVLSGLDAGGVNGLLQSFQQKGLGDIVSSWVGTGQNLPISAEQIKEGLGSDLLASLAEKSGLPAEALSSQIAGYLPDFIDTITPDGTVPEGGLLELGMKYVMGQLS
jgi:uncharacterized protein YidB (DUF937 family)